MSTVAKNPDLIWFEYETRMRKLVQELLEPTIKRSIQDRELYEQLNKKYEEQRKRMDEVEFILHKNQKRQTVFDEINQKIYDLDNSRKLEEKNLLLDIENTRKAIDGLTMEQKKAFEQIKSIDKLTNQISLDFAKTNELLQVYRDSITSIVENIQQEVIKNGNAMKAANIQYEEKFMKTQDSLTEHSSTLASHDINISNIKNSILEINLKLNNVEKTHEDIKTKQQGFFKQLDAFKALNFKVENLELKLKTTDNFIDKYLPFYNQAQISETLHCCLSVGNKRKLIAYEDKKFKELNTAILNDDGNHKLDKKATEIYDILENVIKRYSKAIITQSFTKKGPTESEQDEIDNSKPMELNLNSNHRNSMYQIPSPNMNSRKNSLSDASDKESGSQRNPSTRGSKVNLPNKFDNKSDYDEFEEMMDRDIEKVSNEVKVIKELFDKEIKNLKQDIKDRFARLAKEQVEASENNNLLFKSNFDEIERLLSIVRKERSDNSNDFKGFDAKINKMQESDQKIFNYLKSLSEHFINTIETLNSLLILEMKEEEEKKYSQISMLQKANEEELIKSHQRKKGQEFPILGNTLKTKHEDIFMNLDDAKIPFNGKMITKHEFLQIAFESFRQCLGFAIKFRSTHNFLSFFEVEYRKASPYKAQTSQELKRGLSLNNREERRPGTTIGKPINRLNKMMYNTSPATAAGIQESKGPIKPNSNKSLFVEEIDSKINFHNNLSSLVQIQIVALIIVFLI